MLLNYTLKMVETVNSMYILHAHKKVNGSHIAFT